MAGIPFFLSLPRVVRIELALEGSSSGGKEGGRLRGCVAMMGICGADREKGEMRFWREREEGESVLLHPLSSPLVLAPLHTLHKWFQIRDRRNCSGSEILPSSHVPSSLGKWPPRGDEVSIIVPELVGVRNMGQVNTSVS